MESQAWTFLRADVVFAFGDHRLDIERRELRRSGKLVELEPKAFDLLVFLVQNRQRVVSKDDMLQAVWEGRIVSDSALTTRINAVRRAVGDNGTVQRLVRTIVRKGRLKLSLCGLLGRADEAGKYIRRFRESGAEPTVASLLSGVGNGAAVELVAHMAEGLCRANLPAD